MNDTSPAIIATVVTAILGALTALIGVMIWSGKILIRSFIRELQEWRKLAMQQHEETKMMYRETQTTMLSKMEELIDREESCIETGNKQVDLSQRQLQIAINTEGLMKTLVSEIKQ